MTINDLHMTEEQIVNEIQFMRMWDKYLRKMLGKEKHSELSLGFARMLTSAELKSFGASDEEIEKACNFADMMTIADEHKADTPQTETHDLRTETHECVNQTDCEGCEHWKYIAHEWQCETEKCQKASQTDCETCKHYLFTDIDGYYCEHETYGQPCDYEPKETQTDCPWK